MASFVDFNQRVLSGKSSNGAKHLSEIKALLESTKAALEKERSTLSSAKEETAGFASEVSVLKEKISNVEKVGPERPNRTGIHGEDLLSTNISSELSRNQRGESESITFSAASPIERRQFDGSQDRLKNSTQLSSINENNQASSSKYSDDEIDDRTRGGPKFKAESREFFVKDQVSQHSPVQRMGTDMNPKNDTLLTVVKTNAALSKQLEDLRTASKEQERAYFELLKLVDGVSAIVLGDVQLTKPTVFYIEERHRSLVTGIKSMQEQIKSHNNMVKKLAAENEEHRNAMKRAESEYFGLKSRASLAENQTQLVRSEKERAISEISALQQEITFLKNELDAMRDKHASDVENLKEDFKRKFKATVWSKSGKPHNPDEKGNTEMVVWLDDSPGIEVAKSKLDDAAATHHLSSILAVMSSHNERSTQNSLLQEYALSLLVRMTQGKVAHVDLISSGIQEAATESMRQHLCSLAVQQQGIKFLNAIGAAQPPERAGVHGDGRVGCILQALRLYVDEDPALAEACLTALCTLSGDGNIREIIDFGLEDILRAMRRHAGAAGLQGAAYEILHILSSEDTHAKLIGEKCLIEIIESMRLQVDSEALQESACSVLCNLARDDENRALIMELGLADLLSAMRRFKLSPGVQEKGCAALGNLAADEANAGLIAEEGLADVLEAMSQHGELAGVVQYACTALWYLTTNPGQLERIAEFGLDILLAAVARHVGDADVLGQACGALLNLSLDPRCRELMLTSGCVQTMEAVIMEQAGNPGVTKLAKKIVAQLLKR